MLRLPPFELRPARSAADAAAILAGDGPETLLVAGGTDLWPNLKRGLGRPRTVVSLMSVPELRGLGNGSGELRIGATTLLSDVLESRLAGERYPSLARAVASISSPPLRNLGTLGGNLCLDTRCTYYNQSEGWRKSVDFCLKKEGSVCWVAPRSPRCWAHSASDAAPLLCALAARVRLVSAAGERVIPVEALFRDDGTEYLSKAADEILTDVLLPASSDAAHARSAFWKLRRRGSIDFAVLSVAVALWTDGAGCVERARIFLGAVASRPVSAADAERTLLGEPLTEEGIAAAARLARKVATPLDNTDFQPPWRGKLVELYTEAALREAAGMDPGLRLREARP
ncbi:MAG: FAD binding domain-containing protein, partial [Myxococcota bacterium]